MINKEKTQAIEGVLSRLQGSLNQARTNNDERGQLNAYRDIKRYQKMWGEENKQEQLSVNPAEELAYGTISGLQSFIAGLKQTGQSLTGASPTDKKQSDTEEMQRRELFSSTPAGKSLVGKAAGVIGENIVPALVPEFKSASLLGRAAKSGLTQGALSGATFIPNEEEGSRLNTAVQGGALGSGFATALGVGGKVLNKLKGNIGNQAQRDVIGLGEKHGVDVTAADVAPSYGPLQEKIENLGSKRPQQLEQQKLAATAIADQYRDELLKSKHLVTADLVNLVQHGGKRAEQAKELLKSIGTEGDDWPLIIEHSGKLQVLTRKVKADKLYDEVTRVAGQSHVEPTQLTKILGDESNLLSGDLIKNKKIAGTLNEIKSSLANRGENPLTFDQLRRLRTELNGLVSDAYGANGVGTTAVPKLQNLVNAVNADLEHFALRSGNKELKKAWNEADTFYKNSVVPLADKELAKALAEKNPDLIYGHFVKRGEGSVRSSKFYKALDDRGRAAVRYGYVSNALSKSVNKDLGTFNPNTFINSIKSTSGAKDVFFEGSAKRELDGFVNLLEHTKKAFSSVNKPDTGVKAIPYLVAGGALGALYASPATAVAGLGGALALKGLLTTKQGRDFLLSAARYKAGDPRLDKVWDAANQLLTRTVTSESLKTDPNSPEEPPP